MIATSPDGQWAAIRRGRELALLAGGAGPATARCELATADADMIIVGPPSVLVVVTRGRAPDGSPANQLVLYQPPYLDAVARLELDGPMRIAAITGPRIALVGSDGKAVMIVRIAGRALATQAIDPGSPVEFAVGLERNQILLGLLRKLEAWDAVSGRPLLRMQLPLPPAPRVIGPAHGHLWAIQPRSEHITVCRMSDGRPFRHFIGAPIDDVVYHPSSPLLIIVTQRGLVRLHCFAHSLTVIDAPWRPGMPLGQLVVGDDISLLGLADRDDGELDEEPWRVPIGGAGAPAITLESSDAPSEPPLTTAADKLRAMREKVMPAMAPAAGAPATAPSASGAPVWPTQPSSSGPRAAAAAPAPAPAASPAAWAFPGGARDSAASSPDSDPDAAPDAGTAGAGGLAGGLASRLKPHKPTSHGAARLWRDPLASYGAELARNAEAELPVVAADTELGQLAHRLGLTSQARRALIALYSLYLVGEPALSLARLAHTLGDWSEPLGQGELGALAILRRRGGKVALRAAVCELLDGCEPRAIRLAGDGAPAARPGAFQLARDGKSDRELEHALAAQLGRIAVLDGGAALGLLEARLHGATALALAAPAARPQPWPRDAGLIVIAPDGAAPAWVAALPGFTAA